MVEAINSDAIREACKRCDSIEHAPGVRDADGVHMVLDEVERKKLRERGVREAWNARRVLANIGVGHDVQRCAFTDASKGEHGVGGGVCGRACRY